MSATLLAIATICKYSSDFLKLRKDRKNSEKSETIRDYMERARKEFGRLEMLGVPGTREFHQDLDIAYVKLELEADVGSAGKQSVRAEDVFACFRQLTISGPAGSGKTTLLRWVALKCAL